MAIGSFRSARLRSFFSEPLLQFALVGLLFFAANRIWGARDAADTHIVIDGPLVAHQRQLYQVQYGAAPDKLSLDALLQRYAREEALYREGLRLKLDAGDEVIRQRVVQKMETLLADAEVVPEPTPAQLRQYHQHNAARYTQAGEVSFRQLYFAVEGAGSAAQQRARTALAALRRDAAARVSSDPLGDRRRLHRNGRCRSGATLRRFALRPRRRRSCLAAMVWTLRSPASDCTCCVLTHAVRRACSQLEQVQARVREDFMAAAREAARERRVAEILSRYSVVRTDAP